ncbi:MAG: hypothetical protein J7L11_05680 [Thermoprotei archaeon]|nr:hypothetical protein [Thermoprotei archaeon]
MSVDGILMVYLDDAGLWTLASIVSLFGTFLPIYLVLPLLAPHIFFGSRYFVILFVLASYGFLKMILWLFWFWAINVAGYKRELETLRLKVVSANLLLASIAAIVLAPFMLPDITAFGLSIAMALLMFLIARDRIREYSYRKQLIDSVLSILAERKVLRLEELMKALRIPDYKLRDLLYELWYMDKVDVVEARGTTYVYPRS